MAIYLIDKKSRGREGSNISFLQGVITSQFCCECSFRPKRQVCALCSLQFAAASQTSTVLRERRHRHRSDPTRGSAAASLPTMLANPTIKITSCIEGIRLYPVRAPSTSHRIAVAFILKQALLEQSHLANYGRNAEL